MAHPGYTDHRSGRRHSGQVLLTRAVWNRKGEALGERPRPRRFGKVLPFAAEVVGVGSVYLAAAKLGLSLKVAHGNATPVWAPTGIALAALLLLGRRAWPGVFIGAFVANATTPIPLWAALVIAVGNTTEAVVAVELL